MSSLRDAVRDKLREDKVKLWLPPYDDASKVDALAKAGVLGAHTGQPGRTPLTTGTHGLNRMLDLEV